MAHRGLPQGSQAESCPVHEVSNAGTTLLSVFFTHVELPKMHASVRILLQIACIVLWTCVLTCWDNICPMDSPISILLPRKGVPLVGHKQTSRAT